MSAAGSGGNGTDAQTLIAVPKPGPIARAVKAIPPWGWVALVAAVGVGASVVLGDGGSPFDDLDVDEDDAADDEQDEAA